MDARVLIADSFEAEQSLWRVEEVKYQIDTSLKPTADDEIPACAPPEGHLEALQDKRQ